MKVGDLLTNNERLKIEDLRNKMLKSKNPILVWIYYRWMKFIIQQVKKSHHKGER